MVLYLKEQTKESANNNFSISERLIRNSCLFHKVENISYPFAAAEGLKSDPISKLTCLFDFT